MVGRVSYGIQRLQPPDPPDSPEGVKKRGGGNAVQIIQRHHFASHLKRMVVVVRVQEEFLAFVKGAPETIQDRLIDVSSSYLETYKKYTRQGSRVLALACKALPYMTVSEARSLDRDLVESGLTFAGFAVFNCPIRADSASVLSELKGSSHDLVFARVAPEQKKLIMTTFKTVGRMALMCGDGTNDVGALKQAHVGVALLISVPPAQPGDSSPQTSKAKPKKPKAGLESPSSGKTPVLNGDGSTRSRAVARSDPSGPSGGNRNLTPAEMQRERLKRLMDDMNEEGDGRGPPIVSVMNLDGVKLGDVQATISGIFTAAFFLFISHARPIQTLSAARPHPNIFSAYMFLSLLRQFAIHLLFLISSVNEAGKYMPDECIEPDSDFHPNLVNTVSYMGLDDWLKLVEFPEALGGKLLLWAFLMFSSCYIWGRLLRWAFPGKIPRGKRRQQLAAATLQKKRV
ncbi:hypothetical protein HHK36_004722 [Tetracentron sinense]|uniref:Uncharacterized protein n=1 Tax=Tetracentron sinense TaxID=13715 RepID=A0A834ZJM2_TETSI|nr:hypothetical protein HHK36_004722 [Tetracentron sinense]